ncbi:MAG: hypothetical protein ACRDL5_06355 [Solirubrobacteraceae bacterium]
MSVNNEVEWAMDEDPTDRDDDDTGMGQALFFIFIAASLIATGGVVILAVIDSWALLAVALVIHVTMTVVVSLAVFNAVAGHRSPIQLPHIGARA